MRNKREIVQLWAAASLYWGLVPRDLSPQALGTTIAQWEKRCGKWVRPKCTPELVFTSHLASCAIRLYSIDESCGFRRYLEYRDWWHNRQKGRRCFTSANTGSIVHCVLRNLVAHDEGKGKSQEGTRSYRELKRYYYGLTFRALRDGIRSVSEAIRSDLGCRGLWVQAWDGTVALDGASA